MESCVKHGHEPGVAICRRCGGSWCESCLVYAFGPKKPPYCLGCAMVAGGVRSASARPAMSKKELKARMKAAKAETKAVAKAGGRGAPASPADDEVGEVAARSGAGTAPAAAEPIDWDQPWWEDKEPTFAD